MRAQEFIESKIGVEPKRKIRDGNRPERGHQPIQCYQPVQVKSTEEELEEVSKRGMGTKKRCMMPNAKGRLPASEVSKCKAKGLVTRDTKRKFRIDGKLQSVDGKKVKSDQYGGPIPTWKGN